jgi:hypothetical protein
MATMEKVYLSPLSVAHPQATTFANMCFIISSGMLERQQRKMGKNPFDCSFHSLFET